jgi:hypothetical protein
MVNERGGLSFSVWGFTRFCFIGKRGQEKQLIFCVVVVVVVVRFANPSDTIA